MIEPPLLALVRRRTASIKDVDQLRFSADFVADRSNWPAGRPSLAARLKRPAGTPVRVLAEIKKKSPLAGALTTCTAMELCARYVSAGCHGLSILTDPANFDGHAAELAACSQAHPGHAFLFKDFVTTEYQVQLARTCGASAILLMTQVLDERELARLSDFARACGLEPFIEVHDAPQLQMALALKPPIIGVNARDFASPGMPVNLDTMPALFKSLHNPPRDIAYVAQSGISSYADVRTLEAKLGGGLPDAVQIGSSLSKEGGVPAWLSGLLAR